MKDRKSFYLSWGTFLAVLLAFFTGLNWLSTIWDFRIDLTEGGVYSISEETRRILAGLKDKVAVKYYVSEDLPTMLHNLRRDTVDLLQEYARISDGKLTVEVIDPERIIAEHVEKAKSDGSGGDEAQFESMNPFQQGPQTPRDEKIAALAQEGIEYRPGQIVENDRFEIINFFSSIVIQYLDRKDPISRHDEVEGLEYALASRIVKLSTPEKPKIAFFHGRPEDVEEVVQDGLPPGFPPSKRHAFEPVLSQVLGRLVDVEEVKLTAESLIPESATVLIIAEPNNLNDRQVYEIDRWIAAGRPTVIFAARQSCDVRNPPYTITPLNPRLDRLFEKWGIRLDAQFVASEKCGRIQVMQVIPDMGIAVPAPANFPPCVAAFGNGLNQQSPLTMGLGVIFFPFPSLLGYDESRTAAAGLNITVLARSDEKSWLNGWAPNLTREMTQPREVGGARHYSGKEDLAYLIKGTFPFSHKVGDPVP
ncbi:MAG: GldG family protein, partial [Planctomycetes bacterium]|nr:GldG family protein [Planctomycetota bacterium]